MFIKFPLFFTLSLASLHRFYVTTFYSLSHVTLQFTSYFIIQFTPCFIITLSNLPFLHPPTLYKFPKTRPLDSTPSALRASGPWRVSHFLPSFHFPFSAVSSFSIFRLRSVYNFSSSQLLTCLLAVLSLGPAGLGPLASLLIGPLAGLH
jgi:hypothetical protein